MTLGPPDFSEDTFDPGSMSSSSLSAQKAVWFRRPWFLVTLGAVVVIGISVITDLPHPVTKPEDISQQNAVIKQINGDTAACVYAVRESYSFYRESLAHSLAASNLPTVKNYLLEDQTACSFASGPVYDMTNNIEPIDTTAGKQVDAAYAATVKWITYDGVGVIFNIRKYFAGNTSPAVIAAITKYENLLAQDRASEISDVANASSLLGTTLTAINIPSLPMLPGT
jgi:hypothetical protein